jgi:hypothetical protein
MKWIISHSNKRDDAVYKFKSAAISLIGKQVTEEHFPRIATKVPGWGISFVKILKSQQCKVPPWLQGPKIEPRVPDSRGWDPRSWIGVTPLFFVPSYLSIDVGVSCSAQHMNTARVSQAKNKKRIVVVSTL